MMQLLVKWLHAPRLAIEAYLGFCRKLEADRRHWRATPGLCHDCGAPVEIGETVCGDCFAARAW
jgi:predicted amidophosphoribosyltransferase